jgi:hypothetical protein
LIDYLYSFPIKIFEHFTFSLGTWVSLLHQSMHVIIEAIETFFKFVLHVLHIDCLVRGCYLSLQFLAVLAS